MLFVSSAQWVLNQSSLSAIIETSVFLIPDSLITQLNPAELTYEGSLRTLHATLPDSKLTEHYGHQLYFSGMLCLRSNTDR